MDRPRSSAAAESDSAQAENSSRPSPSSSSPIGLDFDSSTQLSTIARAAYSLTHLTVQNHLRALLDSCVSGEQSGAAFAAGTACASTDPIYQLNYYADTTERQTLHFDLLYAACCIKLVYETRARLDLIQGEYAAWEGSDNARRYNEATKYLKQNKNISAERRAEMEKKKRTNRRPENSLERIKREQREIGSAGNEFEERLAYGQKWIALITTHPFAIVPILLTLMRYSDEGSLIQRRFFAPTATDGVADYLAELAQVSSKEVESKSSKFKDPFIFKGIEILIEALSSVYKFMHELKGPTKQRGLTINTYRHSPTSSEPEAISILTINAQSLAQDNEDFPFVSFAQPPALPPATSDAVRDRLGSNEYATSSGEKNKTGSLQYLATTLPHVKPREDQPSLPDFTQPPSVLSSELLAMASYDSLSKQQKSSIEQMLNLTTNHFIQETKEVVLFLSDRIDTRPSAENGVDDPAELARLVQFSSSKDGTSGGKSLFDQLPHGKFEFTKIGAKPKSSKSTSAKSGKDAVIPLLIQAYSGGKADNGHALLSAVRKAAAGAVTPSMKQWKSGEIELGGDGIWRRINAKTHLGHRFLLHRPDDESRHLIYSLDERTAWAVSELLTSTFELLFTPHLLHQNGLCCWEDACENCDREKGVYRGRSNPEQVKEQSTKSEQGGNKTEHRGMALHASILARFIKFFRTFGKGNDGDESFAGKAEGMNRGEFVVGGKRGSPYAAFAAQFEQMGNVGYSIVERMDVLFRLTEELVKVCMPADWAAISSIRANVGGLIKLPGNLWSYMTLLHQSKTGVHLDSLNNSPGMLTGLATFGSFTGGDLCFLEPKLVIERPANSIIFYSASDLIHFETPVTSGRRSAVELSMELTFESWLVKNADARRALGKKRGKPRGNSAKSKERRERHVGHDEEEDEESEGPSGSSAAKRPRKEESADDD